MIFVWIIMIAESDWSVCFVWVCAYIKARVKPPVRLLSHFSTSTYTPGLITQGYSPSTLSLCTQASARPPAKSLPFIPTCIAHSSDLQPCFAPADTCIVFFGLCVQTKVASDNYIRKKHRLSGLGMFFVCLLLCFFVFPVSHFSIDNIGRNRILGLNPFRNLWGAIRKTLSSGSKPQPSHWAPVFMY